MRGKMDDGKENRKRKWNQTSRKCNKYDLKIVNTMSTPKNEEIKHLETWSSPDGV